MTLNISPEQMAKYRATYKKRQAAEHQKLNERFERAWEVARRGADLLRSQFKAEKVVVFGSLTNRELFHLRSDIDLAVWGLSDEQCWRAWGVLLDLSPEFSVDLVNVETAPERICRTIETKGLPV